MDLKSTIISCIFICFFIVLFILDKSLNKEPQIISEPNIVSLESKPTYINPREDLYKALVNYGIKYPDIVYAQAVLETGNFTSKLCKNYNNLFGLYNSQTQEFFRFHHWIESVEAYKNKVQYKYKCGEDYFEFLERIGYAEDTLYISKLKSILKNENFMYKNCTQ